MTTMKNKKGGNSLRGKMVGGFGGKSPYQRPASGNGKKQRYGRDEDMGKC